jgi:hypothetical protein
MRCHDAATRQDAAPCWSSLARTSTCRCAFSVFRHRLSSGRRCRCWPQSQAPPGGHLPHVSRASNVPVGMRGGTGAGEDNGIDHNKNWLRFTYDSKVLRSHYLHPHPYLAGSQGNPRRSWFQQAQLLATEPLHAERLAHFASAEGQRDGYHYACTEDHSVLDALRDFPSVRPG